MKKTLKQRRILARNMDEQCSESHKHGKSNSNYRCQWRAMHKGKHTDFDGREWR